jgi:sulfur-oxidizing protein SoxY
MDKENSMTMALTRRQALALAAGLVALGGGLMPLEALAAKNDAEDLIKAFTGGKTPVGGKVKLDVPEIAENGNTVPMTFIVDSPMSADDYVTDVLVVADGNPRGGVATFHFTNISGIAEANTRMRLATTQNVVVVAKTSKGEFLTAAKEVKVTIGGCGG